MASVSIYPRFVPLYYFDIPSIETFFPSGLLVSSCSSHTPTFSCYTPMVSSTSACLRPLVAKDLAAFTLCAVLRSADLAMVWRSMVPLIKEQKKEKEADAEQRSGYRGILPLKCRLDVVLELAAERLRYALAYLTKLWLLIGSASARVPVIKSRDTEFHLSSKFGSHGLPLSSSLIQGLLLSSDWFALHILV